MEFIEWVEHVEPVHVNNGGINRQLISVDICQGMMTLHKNETREFTTTPRTNTAEFTFV